jgi:hypothetical protein
VLASNTTAVQDVGVDIIGYSSTICWCSYHILQQYKM